ncbi:adenosylmethionine--8-amino-7-oxononanoate transaminase [Candidatus Synechococcus calcipolaris G9]|uniref:Adenosylmethionine-8-amino-7-oxononanoate aminotransferase n=1 Tax=Candidatus Synechococcus calcipolaris G9 TaxID=1497997 RepID=A0ABT6EXQ7_9SYNE|nr:adenosylmethionine--8-amino-7-oxononanoate transaminase [Candidatus Synechococcus calcipolaris]MDG2990586.1 adenosylmethionine--8-amino-7-oxononanoate transaminase [Candidatus Synechococcus calcipolaris G9]
MDSPIWQPFTQMKTADPPLMVRRGRGATLELEDGRKILDCISSWWVTIHGHGHPVLAERLYQQAQELEHVIFTGFSHEPAEQLARKLLDHVPQSLTRVFFSDNGSTAVEVALKMAYQYWQRCGQPQRSRFLGFEGGYHGDTLGAMAVGQSSPWWKSFQPLLYPFDMVPFPATYPGDRHVDEKEAQALAVLDRFLSEQGQEYAGIFIEPLVQGAAGMRICRPEFLQALEGRSRQAGLLLIYDEVMTGFGRTGELFACLKSGTTPDLLCLSKGLSGGCLPLAVTLATEDIYQAFYKDDLSQAFFHSHSYTGNPLACAVGVTSLELLEQEPQVYQRLETLHWQFMGKWLGDHPLVHQQRTCGTIAAMEIQTQGGGDYFDALGPRLRQCFLEAGFLIRPLGNTIYLMPPYCITPAQLESAYEIIRQVIDSVS